MEFLKFIVYIMSIIVEILICALLLKDRDTEEIWLYWFMGIFGQGFLIWAVIMIYCFPLDTFALPNDIFNMRIHQCIMYWIILAVILLFIACYRCIKIKRNR